MKHVTPLNVLALGLCVLLAWFGATATALAQGSASGLVATDSTAAVKDKPLKLKPKFLYNVDFLFFFDNREYDRCPYQRSQTLFGVRLSFSKAQKTGPMLIAPVRLWEKIGQRAAVCYASGRSIQASTSPLLT